MWLVRVESPWACFGLEVTDDGWIIQAAPIAAWTIGKRGRQVVAHYRGRGGQVSWQQVPHRLSYAGHQLTGTVTELHAAIDALDAESCRTVKQIRAPRSSRSRSVPGSR